MRIDNLPIFLCILDLAANTAVSANCLYPVKLPFAAFLQPGDRHERCSRTNLYAVAAKNTGGVLERIIKRGSDLALESTFDEIDGTGADDFIANPHAAPAQDAVLVIADKEGVVVLVERFGNLKFMAGFIYAEFIGIFLQLACTAFIAGEAVQRVLRDKQVDDQSSIRLSK